MVRWSLDKHYLADLEAAGIAEVLAAATARQRRLLGEHEESVYD